MCLSIVKKLFLFITEVDCTGIGSPCIKQTSDQADKLCTRQIVYVNVKLG